MRAQFIHRCLIRENINRLKSQGRLRPWNTVCQAQLLDILLLSGINSPKQHALSLYTMHGKSWALSMGFTETSLLSTVLSELLHRKWWWEGSGLNPTLLIYIPSKAEHLQQVGSLKLLFLPQYYRGWWLERTTGGTKGGSESLQLISIWLGMPPHLLLAIF